MWHPNIEWFDNLFWVKFGHSEKHTKIEKIFHLPNFKWKIFFFKFCVRLRMSKLYKSISKISQSHRNKVMSRSIRCKLKIEFFLLYSTFRLWSIWLIVFLFFTRVEKFLFGEALLLLSTFCSLFGLELDSTAGFPEIPWRIAFSSSDVWFCREFSKNSSFKESKSPVGIP